MELTPLTDPVVVVLTFLAAARVTRLVTTDTIGEPLRLYISRTDFGRELVHCPWCIGFWISLAIVVVVVASWPHPATVIGVAAFATSEAVGLIAANDRS